MQHVTHQYSSLDGLNLFYREAGFVDAPSVLLLHGSPSSSFQYRHMLPDLSDRWHLIAPDLPPFGFTQLDPSLQYCFTFDNLARTLGDFIEKMHLDISAVYLHDYGAQVGFRLLTSGAIHPKAIIIQNSEAYHGIGWRTPMWGVEKRVSNSEEEQRPGLRRNFLNEHGIRKEFLEDLPSEIARRIDPAPIELGWNKIKEPIRTEAMLDLLMDYGSNLEHYPKVQEFLRTYACPTLLLWGELDQYLAPEAAHVYMRDVPNAEIHFFDGGHWLLESHSREVNSAVRSFLSKHIS
jgi:pimeloyl-ACP methyl ester carboxylesterase